MSGWTFRMRDGDWTGLDMSSIRLSQLRELSQSQVAKLFVDLDGKRVSAGDVFDVRSSQLGKGERVVFQGTSREVHGLAAGHQSGEFRIEGDAGDHLGCSMTGGHLIVQGNAGDFVAGPLRTRKSGMSGGLVEIRGSVGHYLGHRMRRGTVLVFGSAGDASGASMVAGTLFIAGAVGDHIAAGMRRGTMLVGDRESVAGQIPELPDGDGGKRFSAAMSFDAGFLKLYQQPATREWLRLFSADARSGDSMGDYRFERVRADRAFDGVGEIIYPAACDLQVTAVD